MSIIICNKSFVDIKSTLVTDLTDQYLKKQQSDYISSSQLAWYEMQFDELTVLKSGPYVWPVKIPDQEKLRRMRMHPARNLNF